ncbi:MAG TPA: lysophospholipid acyltransferase family protein [Acidobacteriaceae bacterium]|jgi:1-acyl-sn-glycerol-3-phosphate acyltransferase|nr:lysophospholipid acyltransferase family protein [Acidobacteriaceae bacterium]
MPSANETLHSEENGAAGEMRRPSVSFGLRVLTYMVVLPLLAVATAFFGSISLVCGLWDSSGRQQHAIARMWARVLLRIALSPVRVEGLERLQPLRAAGSRRPVAVYASNHLSYYDTPMLFAKLPFQFRILAKASLWKLPFIGWYLNRSGQVPIDQSSARAGVASLGRGVKTLEHGLPLVIFPEGSRAPDGQLRPMVAGAAWMAIKAQVPLVPLTLIGTYELLPIHVYALRPRPLKLIVGEPISTAGLTTRDADALTERLRTEIHRTYIAQHG